MPAMTPSAFAAWRARNGFNLVEAADRLGVTRQTIANWENGVHPAPDFLALACLAIDVGLSLKTAQIVYNRYGNRV
jgi:transcriptional regulator with XRE-family HTH domain